MIRAGPVGETGGHPNGHVQWDEKGRIMISHIYVSFSSELITSVQFGYLENGARSSPVSKVCCLWGTQLSNCKFYVI